MCALAFMVGKTEQETMLPGCNSPPFTWFLFWGEYGITEKKNEDLLFPEDVFRSVRSQGQGIQRELGVTQYHTKKSQCSNRHIKIQIKYYPECNAHKDAIIINPK